MGQQNSNHAASHHLIMLVVSPVGQLSWTPPCAGLQYRCTHILASCGATSLKAGRCMLSVPARSSAALRLTGSCPLQDLTENVLKPTARDVADQLPEAAGRLNKKVKANAEDVVHQLQGQVSFPTLSGFMSTKVLSQMQESAWSCRCFGGL